MRDLSINTKQLFYTACLLLILPNLIFVLAAYWTGDNRSILNIDYLLPFICFLSNKKLIKAIGGLLFILSFLIDLLLIVLQHYPSFNFRDTFYLISFIFSGPKIFLLYALILIVILIAEIFILWQYTKKSSLLATIAIIFALTLSNCFVYFINKQNSTDDTFSHNAFISSGSVYFIKNQETSFTNLLGGYLLEPTPYENATLPWMTSIKNNQPLNDKLLLIIVEAWGGPLNQNLQEAVIKNLKAKSDHFDYFKQGSFLFRGFTVEGELRELCQLHPSSLDLYKIKTGFQNCLPHTLNKLGFETHSTHGGSNNIYGRQAWYPKAGFKTRTFKEDLNIPARCIAFDGICDWDILPTLKRSFSQNKKIFNYWLTLTTHYSYYTHDIHNKRFNCSQYDLPENGDACHSFMLQAQFFDDLANLVTSPEMQGVEVIIVGDHPPPLFKADEIALYKTKEMKDGKVGWMHFKIKDQTTK